MKYVLFFVFIGLVILGYAAYFMVATVQHDPKIWHVDPLLEPHCATPNCFRMAPENLTERRIDAASPVYGKRAADMARAFHELALTQRGTLHVAGVQDDLHLTYVQRTRRLKLPDYVSVKFIDLADNRSTVAVFSRSRFGYGDLGVNAKRVRQWMSGLSSFEIEPPQYDLVQ